jgi:D-alanyl-D-alanine-carboxypeptidase/D-alanyl-D-alanine-endopeptidase
MKYFICFSFLLFSIVTYCQPNATLPDDVVKSIEKRIEHVVNPSIVIGIIDKEGPHYFNFGKKSANGSATDEHTIYEIGSITKVFTAILLAQKANDPVLDVGVNYESLVSKTITSPLEMKETKMTLDEETKKNLATGYFSGPAHFSGPEIGSWGTPTLAGAGEILSSTYDMLKFLAANLGLSQTLLQSAMYKTQEAPKNKADNPGSGLAWKISKGKEGNVIYHSGNSWGYRAFVGFIKETGKGVVVLTNSTEDIEDIGLHLLNPELKLRQIKPCAVYELRNIIDSNGIEAAKNHFYDLKKNRPEDYDFSEKAINWMGYYCMEKNIHAALAIFKINAEMYPNSYNVYDSYAEALMKNGQRDLAIENYKKSVEMNPGNKGGIQALEKMGVKTEPIQIPEATLETYVGIYEFNPSYCIVIAREGKQLFAQFTGYAKFEIFPKTEKEECFIGQIVFNTKGKKGVVKSLTYFYNGKKYYNKKIK